MIKDEICKTIKNFSEEVEKNRDYMKSMPMYYDENLLPSDDNIYSLNLVLRLFEKRIGEIDNELDLLNIQIVLGSLMEIILQLFLKIYYFDYCRDKEKRISENWGSFNRNNFDHNFETFLKSEKLENKQQKKIKKIMKKGLDDEINSKDIDNVMLNDLINFFTSSNMPIIDKAERNFLDEIREKRNFIHPILIRQENDFYIRKKDFEHNLEKLDEILKKLKLPDVPDDEYEYMY